ncbi:MAG: VWA domain-containing protein [Candidatus Hydrogenedentes bacterium]|nr:VWA domain-containing protein [Candidatus Hydrogenedentota bacterium]
MNWINAIANSFIAPQAFWFLGLIPLLVLLYILKLRRSEVIIPSTMLWMKSLQDLTANAPFQKLRRNLLLLLQIIILLLIVFALTRPFIQTSGIEGRNLCLLVDHSASMQTRENDKSRLDLAKEEALKIVESMESGDRAMVIGFAESASVQAELTNDRFHLRNAIKSLTAHDTRSNVEDAAQIIRSIAPINPDVTAVVSNLEVLMFSDGNITEGDRLAALSVPIQYIRIGETRYNAGIINFSTRDADGEGEGRQCFVQVYNDAGTPLDTTLTLYFGEEILGVDELSIPPGDTDEAVFVLPELQDGILRAELDHEDALAVDNRAWLALQQDTYIDVLIAGGADSIGGAMLRHVFSLEPRVRLSVTTPDQYAGLTDSFDLYVFDGWSPPTLPAGALIFINTLPSLPGLVSVGELTNPPIMALDKDHPVMRFTNPSNVSIGKALKVTLPEGARTLVSTDGGPLVADISQALQPMLFIAFDIGDSNWPLHLSFPLFMQNVLAWVPATGSGGEPTLATGSAIEIHALPEVAEAHVHTPGGTEQSIALDPLRPVYFAATNTAGPYEVERGENHRHYALNLLSREESTIHPAETLALGDLQVAVAEGPVTFNKELWRWLLLGALAVLALEWWVYTRRAEF